MSTLKKEWSATEPARLQEQADAPAAELEQQGIRGYERPRLEVVEVAVEAGFATSGNLPGLSDGDPWK